MTDGNEHRCRPRDRGQRKWPLTPASLLVASLLVGGGNVSRLEAVPWRSSAQEETGRADSESTTTAQASLKGRVIDSATHLPLSGVRVEILELGRRLETDRAGCFQFARTPHGDFTLCLHLAGYRVEHLLVSIPDSGEMSLELTPGYQFQEEITVSAAPWADEPLRIPQQVDSFGSERLALSAEGSVAVIAESAPGMRAAYTGDSSSKPVIRGLTGNRVRTLNDGIPTSYQQFGIRHPPNLETLGAERVEITRGPASVLYGSDAMGGVVNVVQVPLPVAEGRQPVLHGTLYGARAGNAHGETGFFRLEGAVGGFGWRGSVVRRSFGDIRTPSRTLDNTGFDQTNGDAAIGYTGSRGSVRVRWHHWENNSGFYRPEGFRVDLQDDLYAADVFLPTPMGGLELDFGHQRNLRKAFSEPSSGQPDVHLDLRSDFLQARLNHRPIGRFRGSLGAQFGFQDNRPLALGKLLPRYESRSWAVSWFEQVGFDHRDLEDAWLLSLGVRIDDKTLEVAPDPLRDIPDGTRDSWNAITASAGLLYRITPNLSLAGSLGRGWRAPSEFELFANGVHGGVGAIQKGDRSLREETNWNSETSLRWSTPRLRGNLTFFNNDFSRYIYLADTGTVEGSLPLVEYRQADAWLRGIETFVEVALKDWLKASAGADYLDSGNRSNGRRLPLTPPARIRLSGRWEDRPRGTLAGTYTELQFTWSARGEICGPDEPFPFDTPSYGVVNWSAGTGVHLSEESVLAFDLLIRNLFDTPYRDFLYTYKGVADMPGRDIRLIARLTF